MNFTEKFVNLSNTVNCRKIGNVYRKAIYAVIPILTKNPVHLVDFFLRVCQRKIIELQSLYLLISQQKKLLQFFYANSGNCRRLFKKKSSVENDL